MLASGKIYQVETVGSDKLLKSCCAATKTIHEQTTYKTQQSNIIQITSERTESLRIRILTMNKRRNYHKDINVGKRSSKYDHRQYTRVYRVCTTVHGANQPCVRRPAVRATSEENAPEPYITIYKIMSKNRTLRYIK
jgi:hypothetical protein